MNTFGERLKWARERVNPPLSKAGLAKAVGLTGPTITKLESGDLKNTSKIVEIADYLGISVYWLKEGEGEPTNTVQKETMLPKLEDTIRKLELTDEELARVEKVALDEVMKIILER